MEHHHHDHPHASHHGHGNFFRQLEEFFETYLHVKVPFHLPHNVKLWIVKFGPWINLVLLVLALPFILAAFGFSLLVLPFAAVAAPIGGLLGIIAWVALLAAFILQIMALPGLFRRSLYSWHLVYYAALLSALGNLLHGDLFSAIVGMAISLYFLFEIREYYK